MNDLPEKVWGYAGKWIVLSDIILFGPGVLLMFVWDLPQLMFSILAVTVTLLLVYIGAVALEL